MGNSVSDEKRQQDDGIICAVLLDVSASMRESFNINDLKTKSPDEIRISSVFKILNSIVHQNEYNPKNKLTSLVFGCTPENICMNSKMEGISALIKIPNESQRDYYVPRPDYKESPPTINISLDDCCDMVFLLRCFLAVKRKKNYIYNQLVKMCEENGAPNLRKYADPIKLAFVFSVEEAEKIYKFYYSHNNKLKEFIDQLPTFCRYSIVDKIGSPVLETTSYFTGWKTSDQIDEHFDSNVEYICQCVSITSPKPSIKKIVSTNPNTWNTDDVASLLRETGLTENEKISKLQIQEIVDELEPILYGYTPMCKALNLIQECFRSEEVKVPKLMFLLSDGDATDGDPEPLAEKLKDKFGVTIISCFATSQKIKEPKAIYDVHQENWPPFAISMFKMSSTVKNSTVAIKILQELSWNIPKSGESRLFVQANHPDVIEEFSKLSSQLLFQHDALVNLMGRVSFDVYINQTIEEFEPPTQERETCYANAVATVIHLTILRIKGRTPPDFETLRKNIINEYGMKSAKTKYVLEKYCKENRLQCKKVNEVGARDAINEERPLIARISLYKNQWEVFNKFFNDKDKQGGIFTVECIKDLKRTEGERPIGHAVVLVGTGPNYLRFMNSKGVGFGDKGFFKIESDLARNFIYYDVYFNEEDLSNEEKEAYQFYLNEETLRLAKKLPKTLQSLEYPCPFCSIASPANQYSGHILEAQCPKCRSKFKPSGIEFLKYLYFGQLSNSI